MKLAGLVFPFKPFKPKETQTCKEEVLVKIENQKCNEYVTKPIFMSPSREFCKRIGNQNKNNAKK